MLYAALKGRSSMMLVRPTDRSVGVGISGRGRPPYMNLPDVEIWWKFCGMLALTGFCAARYVCKVSRTVGFTLVGSLLHNECELD